MGRGGENFRTYLPVEFSMRPNTSDSSRAESKDTIVHFPFNFLWHSRGLHNVKIKSSADGTTRRSGSSSDFQFFLPSILPRDKDWCQWFCNGMGDLPSPSTSQPREILYAQIKAAACSSLLHIITATKGIQFKFSTKLSIIRKQSHTWTIIIIYLDNPRVEQYIKDKRIHILSVTQLRKLP